MPTTQADIQHISLLQLTKRVENQLNVPELRGLWVVAEISEFSMRGHCYLGLVEKNAKGDTVAQMRATIWKSAFERIRYRFLDATGQDLGTGMKVMFYCSVTFHSVYGLSLNITDINPEFTLGEMDRQRRDILMRLEKEGIIDNNKQFTLPANPQRIAVISSPTAAGYGDFINHLQQNPAGIKFYTCLFAASMQGENTAPSIIAALQRIAEHEQHFDCVAIIRGGGSSIDLNWFDDYNLAVAVTQCTLPVITGIGHTRDVSVLDHVAAFPVKTPTAVAGLLIDTCTQQLEQLNQLAGDIALQARSILDQAHRRLLTITANLPVTARDILNRNRKKLAQFMQSVPQVVQRRLAEQSNVLNLKQQAIVNAAKQLTEKQRDKLSHLEEKVNLLSPQNTLNRGYSITFADGKAVTDASTLAPGTVITTHVKNGAITSQITQISSSHE